MTEKFGPLKMDLPSKKTWQFDGDFLGYLHLDSETFHYRIRVGNLLKTFKSQKFDGADFLNTLPELSWFEFIFSHFFTVYCLLFTQL